MGNLVTTAELAGEGFADDGGRLDTIIALAEQYVEHETGFRFYSFSATYKLDGSGQELLVLPQPVITLTSVTEDEVLLDSETYVLYNRRLPGTDDRFYPRLGKVRATTTSSVLGGALVTIWPGGQQNIQVVGTFGFTDLTGSPAAEQPPPVIKRLVARLVAHELKRVGADEDQSALRAMKYATGVDVAGLSVSLAEKATSGGATGDPEIDRILERYRHPLRSRRPPLVFAG